jgi:hypothetical protein
MAKQTTVFYSNQCGSGHSLLLDKYVVVFVYGDNNAFASESMHESKDLHLKLLVVNLVRYNKELSRPIFQVVTK